MNLVEVSHIGIVTCIEAKLSISTLDIVAVVQELRYTCRWYQYRYHIFIWQGGVMSSVCWWYCNSDRFYLISHSIWRSFSCNTYCNCHWFKSNEKFSGCRNQRLIGLIRRCLFDLNGRYGWGRWYFSINSYVWRSLILRINVEIRHKRRVLLSIELWVARFLMTKYISKRIEEKSMWSKWRRVQTRLIII